MFGLISVPAMAHDDDDKDNGECIVGKVKGMSLADEFGANAPNITRCLKETDKVKLVMQINKACRDTTILNGKLENHARSCGASRGYGIAQLKNMIADYKITHDMQADKIDLRVVVHGGGGSMMLKGSNNLRPALEALIADGVKFYFCMNTVRGMAKKMTAARMAMGHPNPVVTPKMLVSTMVIPGVEYVTAGLTAVADFQEVGYNYVQP